MIISPDHHLFVDGVYVWSLPRVIEAWDKTRAEFDRIMTWPVKPSKLVLLMGPPAAGKSTWLTEHEDETVLYVDATFDLPWKRAPWIEKATAHGIPVEVVWFRTDIEVCVERNSHRSSDRAVPEDVLRAMGDKIASSPPSESEGFSLVEVL
jgi:predicted kinase